MAFRAKELMDSTNNERFCCANVSQRNTDQSIVGILTKIRCAFFAQLCNTTAQCGVATHWGKYFWD